MVGGCYFLILDGFLDFFDFSGLAKIFIFSGSGSAGSGLVSGSAGSGSKNVRFPVHGSARKLPVKGLGP